MNRIAVVIPVHPPHYHFMDYLNYLPDDKPFDLYLILSYKSDLEELKKLNFKESYKVLVLEDYMPSDFIGKVISQHVYAVGLHRYGSIITFKKFFALNHLRDTYDFVATMDSEVKFHCLDNMYEKFQNFCNRKTIIGCSITNEFLLKVNKDSSIFYHEDIERLKSLTKNLTNYFWFSDIPIYEGKNIPGFIEKIQYAPTEEFLNKLNWFLFEYVPYVYYCLLYCDYNLVDVNDHGIHIDWSLEGMNPTQYDKVKEVLNYRTLWLRDCMHMDYRHLYADDEFILTYHVNETKR